MRTAAWMFRNLSATTIVAAALTAVLPTSFAGGDPNSMDYSASMSWGGNRGSAGANGATANGFNPAPAAGRASANSSATQVALAMMNRDPRAAAQMLARAAEAGDPEAAMHLGVMYYNGEGIPQSPRDAFVWYTVAARGGVQIAMQYAGDAVRMLSPQDRAAANQRAQQILAQIAANRSAGAARPTGAMNTPNINGGQFASQNFNSSTPAWNGASQNTTGTPNPYGGYAAGPNNGGFSAPSNSGYTSAPNNGMVGSPTTNPNPNFNGGNAVPTGFNNGPQPQPAPTMPQPQPQVAPTPAAPQAQQPNPNGPALPLTKFDAGFFSVQIPQGWQVSTAGAGASFAWVARDPSNPARQVFGIGQVYPLLQSEQAKQEFGQIMAYSPTPTEWRDLPVVGEATPQNFLRNFERIAAAGAVRQAFPQVPTWNNLQITSAKPVQSPFDQLGMRTEVMRARMIIAGQQCDGLFMAATGKSPLPGQGMAGGFYGMTAPAAELPQLESTLQTCLNSAQFSKQYTSGMLRSQQSSFDAHQKRMQTLSEIGDMQMETWRNNSRSQDIGMAQFSDTIRETERLYDPSNGQVYQFDAGFYEGYDLNRNTFEMNNLRQVPYNAEGYPLLQEAPLNGYNEIR